jgi:site-specific recombinase XerD
MELPLKFIIRDDRINISGKCPIYLRYTYQRKFINLPVKYSIIPQFWDKEDGKPRKNYPNNKTLKQLLSEFENNVTEAIEKYKENNGVLPEVGRLKEILNGSTLFQIQQGSPTSLKDLFDDYVQYQKMDGMSQSTLNIYGYTWDKWKQFEKFKKHIYDYKEMNYNTLNDFRIFLKGQNLQLNTVSKYIKTIKSFLSYLVLHKELEVPVSYKKVSVEKEEPEIQVLTQEELDILKREVFFGRNIDHKHPQFNLNEREKLIGQILLFLCHTGLSYADFDELQIQNLIFIQQEKGVKELQIHYTRKKTKKVILCKVPILDITIDLIMDKIGIPHQFVEPNKGEPTPLSLKISVLETYLSTQIKRGHLTLKDRIFPRVISHHFNREIKSVMEKIGVDTPVFLTKFYGGKKKTETVPKYKLIASHTGRRTFTTRSTENGISLLVLKDMTGHVKLQTLARYNKNSAEFIQKEVKSKTPGQVQYQSEKETVSKSSKKRVEKKEMGIKTKKKE